MSYQDLVNSFYNNPRDVHTVPLSGEPIWFYVAVRNGVLYVERAHFQTPSSHMVGQRVLAAKEFDDILTLYYRRKKNESVSIEAKKITQNQVYWYGIFSNMDM